MAAPPPSQASPHLRRAARPQEGAGMTDGQLPAEHLRHREEAADL